MTSHLRPGAAAALRTPSPGPFVFQPESLILPDGPVGEEEAELLEELVHPHRGVPDADADDFLQEQRRKNLPWWKTPSPWWLLLIVPFTAIATSATLAPRIEVYTLLACSVHKPDTFRHEHPPLGGFLHFPDISPVIPPRIPISVPPLNHELTYAPPAFSLQNDTRDPKAPGSCASDPVVQAAVAKLTTAISTATGLLSCLTTAWWGSFSDRHGRTLLLGISVIGLLITDSNFIFVSRNFRNLPGGYWFLVVGPLIEGSLGGLSSSSAAIHAYVADTTTEATRSRMFSLYLGLLFTGMALGPTLGGLLIRFTGSLLSVFYAALFVHLIYASTVWLLLPESLLKSQMQQSKMKYREELLDTARDRELNPAVGLLVRFKRLFAFLSPLTVFLPELKALRPGDNPLKQKRRDSNLTILAAVYGLAVSVMGSYNYKFQFAASTFGWTSETLGYWLTLVGATRAIFLTLILPVIIKVFNSAHEKPNAPAEPVVGEEQPLLPPTRKDAAATASRGFATPLSKEHHSLPFDLGLARASLFIDVVSYTLLAMAPTALFFTVASMLGAMGAGLNPAIQSVALAMYRQRGGTESGRLFGALSVVQALSSQILGPAMYGLVYMKTVATFPRAIFIMSAATVVVSFVLLTFVRLPKSTRSSPLESVSDDAEDEETRVGSERGASVLVGSSDDEFCAGRRSEPSTSSSSTR
ncbi:putative major facilitator superfamily protein [Lyophyllum shimeji]|uniref:Major facilitator superfamily protein n=1 Tax=Lyophyllum shimeji TaxID=47721 RepID=A0A9P3PFL9_LYOSH|nr:putative major facilitator superfamily protein [Lyophyllum shimeji]